MKYDAPNRRQIDDATTVYSSANGSAVVQRLAPGVLLLTSVGEYETPATGGPARELDAELAAHGSLVLGLNMLERKLLARSSRDTWGPWASANRHRIRSHLLVRSKLVDMAISVIAMLAGGIQVKSYSERAAFERAMMREVPGLAGLPPLPALGVERAIARA